MKALLFLSAALAAAPAAAQTRAASADASLIATPAPMAAPGALGSAPALVTLSLSPALAPSLGAAPAAAAAPLPVPLAAPLAVPAPLPASPAALPGNIPAAAASPAAKSAAAAAPLEKRLEDTAISDDGADRTREALLDRLFGEDAGSGEALPPYLRPDQPLAFGARETAEYRAARAPAQKAAAAVPLLESAGVKVEAKDGKVLVLPVKDGTPLNRLAWNLMRAHGAKVVYDPVRLGDSGVAAFNHGENTLFLPHFGHAKSFPGVLHEAHHSAYAARQTRGDLSPFHASVLARNGAVVPRVVYYSSYMSFEELTAHAKTIKHMLAAARRDRDDGFARRAEIDAEVLIALDAQRTAAFTFSRLLKELDGGRAVVPVPAGHWALPELGPIQGGRWMMVELPWSTLFLPVLDEAPAPPRSRWARLFAKKPASQGERAARRTAAAILAYLKEAAPALEALHEELGSPKAGLERLNSLADALTSAGPRAEKAFKAPAAVKTD